MNVDRSARASDPGQGMSLSRRVTGAISASFAVFAVSKVFQIGFLAALARLLSPADFGVAAGATAFLSFTSLLSQMGVGTVIVQTPDLRERTIRVANAIVLATATLSLVLMWLSAPLVATWFQNPAMTQVVWAISLAGLAFGLTAVPQGLMIRDLRARDLALIDLASTIAGTALVAIPLALLGKGYWSLVMGLVVQAWVKAVLVRIAVRRDFPPLFDRREILALWSRGGGFALIVLLTRVAAQCDRIIVGRYLPISALGLYSRANSLMAFPETIYGQVVERVAFPAFAQVQSEQDRLRTAYSHGLSLMAILGMPLTVGLVAIASELVRVVLGPGWQGVIWPFRILSLAMYFRLSVRVGGTVLRGSGQPYLMAATQLVFAILTVAGCLLGWPYGLNGVCAAVVAATTLNYALVTVLACRRTGLDFNSYIRVQLNGLACGLLAVAVVLPALLAARHQGLNAFAVVAFVGGACGVAALAAVLLAPRLFLGRAGNLVLSNGIGILRAATHAIRRRPGLFRVLSGLYHAGLNSLQRLLYAVRPILPLRLRIFAITGRARPTGNIMISPDLAFLYVPVAKAGNSTARRRLLALAGVETPRADAMGTIHRIQAPYLSLADFTGAGLRRVLREPGPFRFTIVRNPYARLASAYRDKILDLNGNQALAPFRHELDLASTRTPTFEQFVRQVAARGDEGCGRHWMSQHRLTLSDLIDYDFIGRVESFDRDFATILERIGRSRDDIDGVEDINRSQVPDDDGAVVYTAEIAALVFERYRRDFERFGYDRDSWRDLG